MEEIKMKFDELNLSENLKRALGEGGYVEATAIQQKAIPHILEGKDLIGQSQTGTGKTAAYGLPMIEKINKEERDVQAIVLCPTRELAVQITGELRKFLKYQDSIKCATLYGGEQIERQIRDLKNGAKIVVGTPGRIMDHMRRNTLKLENVKMVVMDEADEMLNMGFEEDMQTILKEVPEERQTVLFSATMNKRILAITKKYLKNPINVKIEAKQLTVDSIEQIAIELKSKMKDEATVKIIEKENPRKAVVFCNTKRKVDELIEILKSKSFKAECLHGDIKQDQRDRIMKKFKAGNFQILVATDVVARGIDVDELELVINYDIPQEEEYYVHRIGRTGRNGNVGKAYTFFTGKEKDKIRNIEKYAKTRIVIGKLPTDKEIAGMKNKKTIEEIEKIIREKDYQNEDLDNEIYNELIKNDSEKDIIIALLEMINSKQNPKTVVNQENNYEISDEKIKNASEDGYVKIFLNLGKKDKILAKDIAGSLAGNVGIKGEDIGKIKILEKFSFIEIPEDLVKEVLSRMKGKQIKRKDANLEIANA